MNTSVQKLLDTLGIDAILVTDPYNMRYISGFRGGEGTLYISRFSDVVVCDCRYSKAAGEESYFKVE